MDIATARTLNTLTSDFYQAQSASFAQSRQRPWDGWQRMADVLAQAAALEDGQCRQKESAAKRAEDAGKCGSSNRPSTPCNAIVLDLGCGNMRFEQFLVQASQAATGSAQPACVSHFTVHAVDNCPGLVEAGLMDAEPNASLPRADPTADLPHTDETANPSNTAASSSPPCRALDVHFQNLDVMGTLLEDGDLADALQVPAHGCHLSVAFGFMHHVPLPQQRLCVLKALIEKTRPGGFVAVAFWQFANDEKLHEKAQRDTVRAQALHNVKSLDKNDYLLGWQQTTEVFRYCHHFDEDEIDRLICAVAPSAREIARFSADGKGGNLNRYSILRVHGSPSRD